MKIKLTKQNEYVYNNNNFKFKIILKRKKIL